MVSKRQRNPKANPTQYKISKTFSALNADKKDLSTTNIKCADQLGTGKELIIKNLCRIELLSNKRLDITRELYK